MSGIDEFNPMNDLFIAQSSRPMELGNLNLRTLSPYQRALLVIDGTVTKFIEAYTMEPIDTVLLAQTMRSLPTEHVWLEAEQGEEVIMRQVLLRGKYSYRPFAYALSLIVPERIPENIKKDLKVNGGSIGRILLSGGLETRRDVLWYGRESSTNMPEAIREIVNDEFISRTYRIVWNGSPIMLINEKFPINMDPHPSHV